MSALVIVGGTGPQGRGLGLRFAAAGQPIVIGSRSRARADETAATIRTAVPGADVRGEENLIALTQSGRVVLAIPAAGLLAFLEAAGPALAGKLLIDVVVPLAVRHGFAEIAPPEGAPSAAEFIQRRVPAARVVSAFKTIPAGRLQAFDTRLEGDVLVCGDNAAARAEVMALVTLLPGLRPVDAGRLANSRYVEAITALLVNLNRQHAAETTITVVGLPVSRTPTRTRAGA